MLLHLQCLLPMKKYHANSNQAIQPVVNTACKSSSVLIDGKFGQSNAHYIVAPESLPSRLKLFTSLFMWNYLTLPFWSSEALSNSGWFPSEGGSHADMKSKNSNPASSLIPSPPTFMAWEGWHFSRGPSSSPPPPPLTPGKPARPHYWSQLPASPPLPPPPPQRGRVLEATVRLVPAAAAVYCLYVSHVEEDSPNAHTHTHSQSRSAE